MIKLKELILASCFNCCLTYINIFNFKFDHFILNNSIQMDNYHILHPIGEGNFGKVFKGRRK